MSKTHSLEAAERVVTGTGGARELRRNSMVPAIIYGAGKPQVMISLPHKELTLEYHKKGFLSHMFDIKVGKHTYTALPKEIQLHPVTDEIEHMDFIHVDLENKMKVHVTLHFTNENKCPGIKSGGTLNIARHDIELYCLPSDIPESIDIDVQDLVIGQSIHISDITLPKNVETKLDPTLTVAALVAAKVVIEEEEGDAATEEEETTDTSDEEEKKS